MAHWSRDPSIRRGQGVIGYSYVPRREWDQDMGRHSNTPPQTKSGSQKGQINKGITCRPLLHEWPLSGSCFPESAPLLSSFLHGLWAWSCDLLWPMGLQQMRCKPGIYKCLHIDASPLGLFPVPCRQSRLTAGEATQRAAPLRTVPANWKLCVRPSPTASSHMNWKLSAAYEWTQPTQCGTEISHPSLACPNYWTTEEWANKWLLFETTKMWSDLLTALGNY